MARPGDRERRAGARQAARPAGSGRSVVTIGVFDGVHRAHARLIQTAVRHAARVRGRSIAVTFDPDPHAVLDPARAPKLLMPMPERARQMRALGLDRIVIIPFTRAFARLSPGEFIRRILVDRLRAAILIVGEDFVFGRGRQGTLRTLREYGRRRGLRVVEVKQLRYRGEAVSSSRIRRELAEGQLSLVRALLGRHPALYGRIVRGAGRGRGLGFPTANIRLSSQALPPQGVYAVRLRDAARKRHWNGVMNLGVRPTFGPGPLTCEVHLPGFSGSLLARTVEVELLARLRGEQCFASLEAFRRQVRHDLSRARRAFRTFR